MRAADKSSQWATSGSVVKMCVCMMYCSESRHKNKKMYFHARGSSCLFIKR